MSIDLLGIKVVEKIEYIVMGVMEIKTKKFIENDKI